MRYLNSNIAIAFHFCSPFSYCTSKISLYIVLLNFLYWVCKSIHGYFSVLHIKLMLFYALNKKKILLSSLRAGKSKNTRVITSKRAIRERCKELIPKVKQRRFRAINNNFGKNSNLKVHQFQYCDSNIGLFSIAPYLVIALNIFA